MGSASRAPESITAKALLVPSVVRSWPGPPVTAASPGVQLRPVQMSAQEQLI
jgi:hypothetical protein